MSLLIRKDQMAAFQKSMQTRFRERVIHYLSDSMPEFANARNHDQINQFLDNQEERARKLGVTTERQLVHWFYLAAAVSETFDEIPEVSRFLQATKFTMSEKLDGLMHALANAAASDRRANV